MLQQAQDMHPTRSRKYQLLLPASQKGLLNYLVELWQRRELIAYLVRTDMKVIYYDKILGALWALLDPLIMMAVYIFLVVIVFGKGGPQFPVLLFSALLAWRWFVYATAGSVKSIIGKAGLIQSVRFPLAVLPLYRVILGLVNYFVGFVILIPLLFIYEANLTWHVLWMPLLILIQMIFTVGFALMFASVGVYFRDLENVLEFIIRVWFYFSPAMYSAKDRIPEKYLDLYMLNPFASIFESYKNVLVYGQPPSEYIWEAVVISLVVFFAGLWIFVREEPRLVKYL